MPAGTPGAVLSSSRCLHHRCAAWSSHSFETACTPSFTARSTEPDRFSPVRRHHTAFTAHSTHGWRASARISPATTCVMKVASHFLWHCAPAVDMARTCLGRVATRAASRLLQQRAPSDSASRQKAHLWWTRRAHLADTSQTWRGGERRQHGASSSRDGPLSASLGPSPHTSRGGPVSRAARPRRRGAPAISAALE